MNIAFNLLRIVEDNLIRNGDIERLNDFKVMILSSFIDDRIITDGGRLIHCFPIDKYYDWWSSMAKRSSPSNLTYFDFEPFKDAFLSAIRYPNVGMLGIGVLNLAAKAVSKEFCAQSMENCKMKMCGRCSVHDISPQSCCCLFLLVLFKALKRLETVQVSIYDIEDLLNQCINVCLKISKLNLTIKEYLSNPRRHLADLKSHYDCHSKYKTTKELLIDSFYISTQYGSCDKSDTKFTKRSKYLVSRSTPIPIANYKKTWSKSFAVGYFNVKFLRHNFEDTFTIRNPISNKLLDKITISSCLTDEQLLSNLRMLERGGFCFREKENHSGPLIDLLFLTLKEELGLLDMQSMEILMGSKSIIFVPEEMKSLKSNTVDAPMAEFDPNCSRFPDVSILLTEKFDPNTAKVLIDYTNEFWVDKELVDRSLCYLCSYNTCSKSKQITKLYNWKRKRYVNDISYLRDLCGYPRMYYFEDKINPTLIVRKYFHRCIKMERDFYAIERSKLKGYNQKNWRIDYEKSFYLKLNKSKGHIKVVKSLPINNPTYHNLVSNEELMKKKSESNVKRTIVNTPEIPDLCKRKNEVATEINYNLKLKMLPKCDETIMNLNKTRESLEEFIGMPWFPKVEDKKFRKVEKNKGLKGKIIGPSGFEMELENAYNALIDLTEECEVAKNKIQMSIKAQEKKYPKLKNLDLSKTAATLKSFMILDRVSVNHKNSDNYSFSRTKKRGKPRNKRSSRFKTKGEVKNDAPEHEWHWPSPHQNSRLEFKNLVRLKTRNNIVFDPTGQKGKLNYFMEGGISSMILKLQQKDNLPLLKVPVVKDIFNFSLMESSKVKLEEISIDIYKEFYIVDKLKDDMIKIFREERKAINKECSSAYQRCSGSYYRR